MKGKIKLMHKDNPVCLMQLNNTNQVEKVIEIYNESLLPPSVSTEDDRDIRIELTRWLKSRIYSPGRLDLMEVTPFLCKDGLSLAGKQSLYDCYWLSNKSNEKWENINPYVNWDFYKDEICLLNLKPEYFKKDVKIDSPCLSVPGREIKIFFKNKKGDIFLLSQNVIKEMTFYKKNKNNPMVARRKYISLFDKLFTARRMFTNENLEAFPLSELLIKTEGFSSERAYEDLIHCIASFGISRTKAMQYIDLIVAADENINDSSREADSIYLLRDANTLKFVGIATV